MDHCPRCGSEQVIWQSRKKRLQFCRSCHRSFTPWTEDVSSPQTLGQYLCLLRGKAGATTKSAAAQIGISAPFITMVERGRKRPSLATLDRWVAALDGHPELARQFWETWRKQDPQPKRRSSCHDKP